MADNKKDAKREAKIEAKRRKLAEQRAARAAAGDAQNTAKGAGKVWYDADREVIGQSGSSGSAQQPAAREITADTANRERHIRISEYPRAEQAEKDALLRAGSAESGEAKPQGRSAAADVPQAAGPQKSSAAPEAPRAADQAAEPETGTAKPAEVGAPGSAEGGTAASRTGTTAEHKGADIAAKIFRGIGKVLLAIFGFIAARIRRFAERVRSGEITPAYIARCLLALIVLIGLVYGALRITDYYDKKSDYTMTDEGHFHAAKYDACVPLNGIDISEHQKGSIDWPKLKTSGCDYVFIRAGYRAADDGTLHADKDFEKNVKAASKAGLMVGVYFYSQALTPEEGREEAEFVLDMVKDYDITMPIAIDYEIYKDGRLDKKIQAGELYAASLYHDIVLGFTNRVEEAGYESAVYANRDMLTNYMQADLLDDMATIWLARYEEYANLDAEYWFWQCTENGKAGGIDGAVDQDFWYVEPNRIYETRAKHKDSTVSIGDCRISFKRSAFKLRNFRAEPKFGMTYEGTGMAEGKDYISSVVHNTKTGRGYVIVRGIGKFKDWIMYPFDIE